MFKMNTVIFICFFYHINADDEVQKKIQDLVKEKNDLFIKINEAIDKNVNSFGSINETEAILAVDYLKNLKDQIKEFNRTDNITDVENSGNDQDDITYRRKAKKSKNIQDFMKDMQKILKPKDMPYEKLKTIIETRDRVRIQLDEWIEERRKEKERIRKYREQMRYLERVGRVEKCPRFGWGSRLKKKKKDSYRDCKKKYKDKYDKKCNPNRDVKKDKEEKPLRTRTQGRKVYPCCRKCCKKSYMGCL